MKIKGLGSKHFKELVKSSIDFEYLDGNSLGGVFHAEYGWNIDQIGIHSAASEYLAGLPSVCTVPFSNYDIIQWVQSVTGRTLSEIEQDFLLENYFNMCGNEFIKLLTLKGKKL